MPCEPRHRVGGPPAERSLRESYPHPLANRSLNRKRRIHPETLKTEPADKHLIDVRRAADRDASIEQIPGAAWHDPERIAEWIGSLPKDREIV